jgi:hypothetical protein
MALFQSSHNRLTFTSIAFSPSKGFNAFTGSIPSDIGSLTALTTLEFGRCSKEKSHYCLSLCSHSPLLLSISQYPAEDENQFTGTIPSEIGSLTSLTALAFGTSQLPGFVLPILYSRKTHVLLCCNLKTPQTLQTSLQRV